MTSEERREARYRRRVAARLSKKEERCAGHDDFEVVFSYRNLYKAYQRCRKGVAWKASVQRYISAAPLNVYRTYKQLMAGTFRSPGFFEFDLYERGKKRHIRSTIIEERVVQRCLCDNALVPVLTKVFIHDNGACMIDKGYDFAIRRMTQHLREHYRKYGNEGYILLFDFKQFFDNISHEIVKEIIRENFTDERLIALTEYFIDCFGVKGLGLGSQISQVLALASANRLDHYIKEALRVRGYNRYNDDGYLLSGSKEELKAFLEVIRELCAKYKITLNEKKTNIVKLSHGFTWLKVRVFLTEEGLVLKKICKKNVTRARQRIKKIHQKWVEGVIPLKDVECMVNSWKSYAAKFKSDHTVENYDKLVAELFYSQEGENALYQSNVA